MFRLVLAVLAVTAIAFAQDRTNTPPRSIELQTTLAFVHPSGFYLKNLYLTSLAGPVVSACPDTTVLALSCIRAGDACDYNSKTFTSTVGPSIFIGEDEWLVDSEQSDITSWKRDSASTMTYTTSCDIIEWTSAICSWSAQSPTPLTVDTTLADSGLVLQFVTITAGYERLARQTACPSNNSSDSDNSGKSDTASSGGSGGLEIVFLTVCGVIPLLAALML